MFNMRSYQCVQYIQIYLRCEHKVEAESCQEFAETSIDSVKTQMLAVKHPIVSVVSDGVRIAKGDFMVYLAADVHMDENIHPSPEAFDSGRLGAAAKLLVFSITQTLN